MKTRKYIYLVLGILFILFDIFATWSIYLDLRSFKVTDFGLDFILRTQWMLIPGLIFFIGVYRVQRKINRNNKQALENAFAD
jgi:hypothetical protein